MIDGNNLYELLKSDLKGRTNKDLLDVIIYLRDWYSRLEMENQAINRVLNQPDMEKIKLNEKLTLLEAKCAAQAAEIKRFRSKKLTLSERITGKMK